jgi:hypothetical protein
LGTWDKGERTGDGMLIFKDLDKDYYSDSIYYGSNLINK